MSAIMDAVRDETNALNKRIERLEAALLPFAKFADTAERLAAMAKVEPDAVVGPARYEDCKRAREALSI